MMIRNAAPSGDPPAAPAVSVLCLSYNHIRYIRQCLDSLLAQETNFDYEIVVHDDRSTDGTAEVLAEYEKEHDNLRVLYEEENQYSKGVKIIPMLVRAAKGKYLAFCECDDFFCDNRKLQLQFDALENNPDCIACIHDAKKLTEQGTYSGLRSPRFRDEKQDMKQILYCVGNLYALNSLFVRKEGLDDLTEDPLYIQGKVGDIPVALHLAMKGNFFYIREALSVYRVGSSGSWSVRMKKDKKKALAHANNVVDTLKRFDEMTGQALHEDVLNRIDVFEFQRVRLEGKIGEALSPRFRKRFLHAPLPLKIRLFINGADRLFRKDEDT